MREALARLALVAGSLAFLFVLGELALRWWFPPADFGDDRRLAQRFHPHRKLRYTSAFGEYDVTSRYNSIGMRDFEHPREKPAGARRIVVIGDSFVEAKMIPLEETFPARLERILSQSGPVDVINAGHSGFGSMEEFLVLRHFGIGRDPDLVIQAFVMNDPSDDWEDVDDIEWDEQGPLRFRGLQSELALFVADYVNRLPFVWKRKTVRSDFLGDIERDPFAVMRPGKALDDDEHWARTLRAVTASARLCEKHGIAFLLIVVPLAVQVDAAYAAALDEDIWQLRPDLVTREPQKRLLRLGAEQGFAVLDLIPVLEPHRDRTLYYRHDAHWTPEAHAIVARALAAWIEASNWQPPPGPLAWPPPGPGEQPRPRAAAGRSG